MNRRTHSILTHMLEDAQDVITFSKQAGSFETFCDNTLYRKAIVMSVINIGELTKCLADDFKAEHKEIPWRKISGMRDIAAHGYHTMDEEVIWDVAQNSIPELISFLLTQLT